MLWLILWRVLISRKQFEPFLIAAIVGVRSVRSDRTPQTPRTVRLFGGLKSDFRAVVDGLGLALQQPFALKGSQCPQCFAVLFAVLGFEAVAVLNHVPAGRALELLPTLTAQLQNVSHGTGAWTLQEL